MQNIRWVSGAHEINYDFTQEQLALIEAYKKPLERKLAEEQAARYRRDPDTYRALVSVASMLDEGDIYPYLGAIGGGGKYIFHLLFPTAEYAVQYQYLDNKPIWLTPVPSIKAEGIYRVTPTSLGYIVHYEVDISDYDSW